MFERDWWGGSSAKWSPRALWSNGLSETTFFKIVFVRLGYICVNIILIYYYVYLYMYNYIFHPGPQNLFLPLSYQSLLFLMITGFKVPFLTGWFPGQPAVSRPSLVPVSPVLSEKVAQNLIVSSSIPILSHQSTLKHMGLSENVGYIPNEIAIY